jgi:AcrR family transcriptional regulator
MSAPYRKSSDSKRNSGGVRRQESERRRRRILEAARACFGRLGFAGATVEVIAREAGVSNGLLYQHFRGKEELFAVVLEETVRDWARAMSLRDRPGERTAAQALEAMFRASVAFAESNPLLPKLLADDAQLELRRFHLRSADRVEPHRRLVREILRRGIEAGEFRADLDVANAADVICQLQVDYSGRAYRRDPAHPVTPALIDTAIRMTLDALRP